MQRSSSLVNMAKPNDYDHELPIWDPLSETTKKEAEAARDRLAASLVHLLPLLIILSALLLWFFSYPPEIKQAEPGRLVIMNNVTAFER